MKLDRGLGLAGVLVAGLACGSANAAPSGSVPACNTVGLDMARKYGNDARLIASYDVPAAQMVRWEERTPADGGPRVAGSQWRGRPSTERVAVCYYDGNFENFGLRPGPVGTGSDAEPPPPRFERLLVTVDGEGRAALKSIGPAAKLRVEDPNR